VSDRRSYKRSRLAEAVEGNVRFFPDVMVEPCGDDEWIAIGREAGVAGEALMLDVVLHNAGGIEVRHRVPVCVMDSHPFVLEGDLRYRIRLHGGPMAAVLFEQQIGRG
jgi:hypothetical protein